MKFVVTGTNRQVGAIGVFESFEIEVEAEGREAAFDAAREARYAVGFEHVHVTEVVRIAA
jgi:hypothetical protein